MNLKLNECENVVYSEGCPVPPGGTLQRTIQMTPRLGAAAADRHGVALDGRLHNEDTDLASTTLMASHDDRDAFGIIVTYQVKVRLFLGALAGELVGELPIVLMHPKVLEHHHLCDELFIH